MALADDLRTILDALPPDWTVIELDMRIEDEYRYIERDAVLRARLALAPAGGEGIRS